MIIVDASVAVKVITREPNAEAALQRLLADDERIAPDWITIEVANALANKVRHNGLPREAAESALAALPEYLTETADSVALLDEALALGMSLGHAVYDCLYLALAIRNGSVVVTADEDFVKAAERAGHAVSVELLR